MPHGTVAVNDERYCRFMLPKVSRTFALTIRLLPPGLGYTVTIAYLLCRIADTIEDAANMEPAARVILLSRFRDTLADASMDAAPLRIAFAGATVPDQALVRDSDNVLREYWRLSREEREAIRPSVQEMCDGMASFVISLAARSGQVRMLDSVAELERYCYYVAGTVGHLLTRLFILHGRRLPSARTDRLWALSTRFALGLQVTNIVQDVAADAERGVGFVPHELLAPGQGDAGCPRPTPPALNALVELALARLWDAIDYCACIPRNQYRIRLFCLAAPYFAVRTLRSVQVQLESGLAQPRPKISRAAVYRTLVVTILVAPSNKLMRAYFSLLAGGVRVTSRPHRD